LQGTAVAEFAGVTLGGLTAPAENADIFPAETSLNRIDAVWKGSIKVSSSFPQSRLEDADYATLSLAGIDEEIAAGNGGALPADLALEAARMGVLKGRIAGNSHFAQAASNNVVETLLQNAGASTVGALLQSPQAAIQSSLKLTFSDPLGGSSFTQMSFPVAVGVALREPSDPSFSLLETISGLKEIQQKMKLAGFEPTKPSPDGGLGRGVAALVVPQAWFSDVHWPGADLGARKAEAGAWLAKNGIGLVPFNLPASP